MSGTKVRVESSFVQIVLPFPILRNKKKIMVSNFIVFIRLQTACHFFFFSSRYLINLPWLLDNFKNKKKIANVGNGNNTTIEQMNFFKKQLLHHRICCIFRDIRNNAFLLSGSTVTSVRTISSLHCVTRVFSIRVVRLFLIFVSLL